MVFIVSVYYLSLEIVIVLIHCGDHFLCIASFSFSMYVISIHFHFIKKQKGYYSVVGSPTARPAVGGIPCACLCELCRLKQTMGIYGTFQSISCPPSACTAPCPKLAFDSKPRSLNSHYSPPIPACCALQVFGPNVAVTAHYGGSDGACVWVGGREEDGSAAVCMQPPRARHLLRAYAPFPLMLLAIS
jgi:hypothetical protein